MLFLLCKGIADGRNVKCGIEGLAAAFRKFSRYSSKIWVFRLHPLLITLALFSLLSAMESLQVKKAVPATKLTRLHKREKELKPIKTKNYAN